MIVNTCEINGEEFVIVERTNYEKLLQRVDELNRDLIAAQEKAKQRMKRARHLTREVDSFATLARVHLKQGIDALRALDKLCDE